MIHPVKAAKWLSLKMIIVAAAGLVVAGIASFQPIALRTTDSTQNLNDFLQNTANSQVLGANTNQSKSECPSAKPIIGWINYEGRRVIKQELPPQATPSACFESVDQAHKNGFQAPNNQD
jgi:hypothetical protein